MPMYTAFSQTIRLAREIGLDCIVSRKRELYEYCRNAFLQKIPEAVILSPEDQRLITGIFSFRLPGMDHREIVKQAWEEEKIIIQWRTVNLYTKEEGIRVSLNWFVMEEEIDQFVSFIRRIVQKE